MRSYGYDDTTIAKAMDLHDGTTAKVKWGGKRSEPVPTSWGVEQGAPASNPLWNPYADLICRQTIADCGPNAGIQIYHQPTTQLGGFPDLPPDPTIVYLHSLLLADDIVVLADSAAQLQTFLLHLEKNCKRWGMRISKEKTKLMTFGASAATPAAWSPICIDGSPLEVVDAYKYLGSWFSESCTLDKELSVRIGHAIAAAVRLRNIWRSESWPLTEAQTAKLETFHQRQLRIILRISWWQHISNNEVLQRAQIYSIGDRIRQVRMLWLGHVMRMGPSRIPYQTLFGQLSGRRRAGRSLSLTNVYSKDLDVLRGGLPNGLPWIQATFDKRAWKNFVLGNFDTSPQAPAPAPPFQGPPGLPIAGDRTLVRMGLAPNNLLLPGVPDRRPYTPPSGPYTGAPRGRPRGSGKRSRRGRRPGSSVSRAGRSEDEGVVPSVHSDGSTLTPVVMAHARDILQGVVDGLGGLVAALPQGDWQQVASHLAAPGQQQIIQQQQQILNQQQQVSEQQRQAIPQMQATLQAVQQQLQQMQGTLHQMQQQTEAKFQGVQQQTEAKFQEVQQQMEAKFHQMQQQTQAIPQMQATLQEVLQKQQQTQTTLQDVLQEQQQMQQDLAVIRWTQANAAIRFQNKRCLEHLHPLYKEREAGNRPAGDLPSADVQFPATYTAVFGLSNSELTKLETFYQVQFAGTLVQERRRAFWEYISEPAAS